MSLEKYVIIGSNSFSGASFIARLLAEDSEIIGMSRSSEPNDVFLPYKWMPHDRFSFYQLDLNHDLDEIMSIIDSFKPDYVVNFASQSMVPQSWDCPQDWFITNTVSMVNLHDRLRKCNFLKKFVQISTPEVYGSTSGTVREDALYNPSTPYAVSRTACDMSLTTFYNAYKFPVVFTRAANVCGPGQQLYRILPRTIFCILSGEKLRLEGGGCSVRSFIHIRDVVEGTLKVARQGTIGEIYHFSTDRQVSIRELVEIICDKMGVSFKDHVEISPPRPGEDPAYLLDCTKAKTDLNWTPEFSLEDTIAETINWLKNNLDVIKQQPRAYIHKP